MSTLLPIAYFGNVEYFWHIAQDPSIQIDTGETYQKQTYRNRCVVLGANGPLNLSVPVIRPNGQHTKTEEVMISEAENWRQVHLKTLESCYNRTPYFEFYIDAIRVILETDYKYLHALTSALTLHLVTKIGLVSSPVIGNFKPTESTLDLRDVLSPKKQSDFFGYNYIQTFTERYGFVNNLSILDLLFNEGPNSICIINESSCETK
ncbi:MAG: WbqC family protein [Putridiphycobacter sp.]|nr:WbqC family protein [Putridiphycobacter sp.]